MKINENPFETTMPRRRFGRTEIQMPVLSTGGMRFQDGWEDKPFSQVANDSQINLEATIRKSFTLGLNHFETARGYGVSERQLGQVLPLFPREQLIAQTKVAPTDSAEQFESDFRDSLARLQLSHVDLLGIHGINNGETLEQTVRPGGCLGVARRLQKEGLCRHVGFSTHGDASVITEAIQHQGDGGFDYVNLHWFFIMQRNWPAIQAATKRDMGVFIISPSDKGGMLYSPPRSLSERCAPLHPMAFNDLFCLAQKEIHTISVGAAKPSDFDIHVDAVQNLDRAKELTDPVVARLQEVLREKTGSADPENMYGFLPPFSDCPGQLNLRVMHWLHQLAVGLDLIEYGKMRFNLLGDGDHWFPGANAEELHKIDDDALLAAAAQCPNPTDVVQALRHVVGLLQGEKTIRISST